MSEPLDCGHTEEEHAEMAKKEALSTAAELLEGNFTSMFATLPTMMLQTNIEAALMEMFLRSPNDEEFRSYVEAMLRGIIDILVPEDGESSKQDLWDRAHEMREKIQGAMHDIQEGKEFMEDATDELRIMLEQHGVTKKDTDYDPDGPYR